MADYQLDNEVDKLLGLVRAARCSKEYILDQFEFVLPGFRDNLPDIESPDEAFKAMLISRAQSMSQHKIHEAKPTLTDRLEKAAGSLSDILGLRLNKFLKLPDGSIKFRLPGISPMVRDRGDVVMELASLNDFARDMLHLDVKELVDPIDLSVRVTTEIQSLSELRSARDIHMQLITPGSQVNSYEQYIEMYEKPDKPKYGEVLYCDVLAGLVLSFIHSRGEDPFGGNIIGVPSPARHAFNTPGLLGRYDGYAIDTYMSLPAQSIVCASYVSKPVELGQAEGLQAALFLI